MNNKSIYVTQPTLPPLEEYVELLETIWSTGILTHNGPILQMLEEGLKSKLGVNNLAVVINGTIALQMAIKTLELKGEIITTPFSWIATISAIKWEGCTPIFCDIEEDTFNIDPGKIEALITDKTVAIMPVHVFGNPCDVEAIEAIALKYDLKVIYDAAHALGSTYSNKSIFEYGDISATSLHATKLFNTAEGGACVVPDDELFEKLKRIRFFGHDDKKNVVEDGLNGKMTEVHAALGVANLKYYDEVLSDRFQKYKLYKSLLSDCTELSFQNIKHGKTNHSYFPIVFRNESALLKVEEELNRESIFPRRYFYPSLNTYAKVVDYHKAPVSESLSKRILCLPLYKNLNTIQMQKITEIILKSLK